MSKWRNPTGHKINGKWRMLPLYNQWFDMYQRCTSERSKTLRPTYRETTLCDDWYSYDNYCDWAKCQIGFGELDEKQRTFQLDKDLLGGKAYSPEFCVFIPKDLNVFAIKLHTKAGFSLLPSGKFRADIYDYKVGKNIYLGSFDTATDAHTTYRAEKAKLAKELAEKYKDVIDFRAYEALMSQ